MLSTSCLHAAMNRSIEITFPFLCVLALLDAEEDCYDDDNEENEAADRNAYNCSCAKSVTIAAVVDADTFWSLATHS